MTRARQAGFTLIEMIITVAILAVVLAIVLSVSGIVGKNLSVNRRQGDLRERVQLASARIASFLRPASLDSLRVEVAGSWVAPVESTAYGGIQFRTLTGYPYGVAPVLGPLRVIRFQRDANELANGLDDDGDGLIDEGGLYLDDAGASVRLTDAVEVFRVSRTGRVLVVTIQCSGRNSEGGMHRSRFDQTIILRNN